MDIYDPIGEALGLEPIEFQFNLSDYEHNRVPTDPWNKGYGDYMLGENNPMYGIKRPQSVKDAISKANTGKKNVFLVNLNKSRIGKSRSEETKRKISETKKKQALKPNLGRKNTLEELQRKKERKWWNNGVEEKMCSQQPQGFIRGRLPKII